MGLFLRLSVLAVTTWNVVAAINSTSEVGVSVCNWAQLRANVIRDTIYLDGGSLVWLQYVLFRYAGPVAVVYNLSLTMPFDQTTNLTSLFKPMLKPTTSNFIDGAMFVSDEKLILYGGLDRLADNGQGPPAANLILEYEQHHGLKNNINGLPWPSFIQTSLPDGLTRYVTSGGAVSIPSENFRFYFSGVRGQNWGVITDDGQSANVTANTLITVGVNVPTVSHETWSNETLSESVPGRINAELVWIPVSQLGVLIAIGGVLYSDALTRVNLTATQAAASNKTSPTFMQTVPVYDIANRTWYMQQTSGDIPPQLTLFCSVVAAAVDNSSYNIYIYGGYDGIDSSHATSDDVYVLSIPSFTWIKVYSGTSTHGRTGHKCVKVYPDQMFVLGGIHQGDGRVMCLEGGIIQVFNLNTLKFQDSYSPTTWSEYNVPSLVTAQIGGNKQGGATKRAPANWTTSLATVFQSKYLGTITTYHPYSLAPNTTSMPLWLRTVIGVILNMAVIGILVVWIFCRQRSKRNAAKSMILEADSGFTHESGGRQVHELGEYQGYNRLTLLIVPPAFLIVFAFTDSSRPVELPTNYNNSSIYQVALTRLHQMSDSPSLDKILVLNIVGPEAGIQNNKSRRTRSLPSRW
ncbi:hypothetical protein V8E54_000988 [Elaphomyces granulatus]